MAKMKDCAACGKSHRKGVRAFVIGHGMGVVCSDCASWGLVVCATRGKVDARVVEKPVRDADIDRVIRELRTWSKLAAQVAHGESVVERDQHTREHFRGRAEAMDSAIEKLVQLQKGRV